MLATRYSTRRSGQALADYALLLGLLGSGAVAIAVMMGTTAANAYHASAKVLVEADAGGTSGDGVAAGATQPIAESPSAGATSAAASADAQSAADLSALPEGVGFGPSMSAGATNNGNHYGQYGEAPADARGAGNGQGNASS